MLSLETIFITLLLFVVSTNGFTNDNKIENHSKLAKFTLSAIRVNGKNEKPGSELFPGKGPYIPSGLSQEQYIKLKRDESEQMKQMNFGAWGPRFKRTETPNGDWMVMPSLWTNGFNAQTPTTGVNKAFDAGSQKRTPLVLATSFLRKKFASFLLGYIILYTCTTAISLYKIVDLTTKHAILTILRVPLLNVSSILTISFLKTISLKFAAVALLSPITTQTLEAFNRQRLWSNRKAIFVCSAASLGLLSLWALLLRLAMLL